MWLSAPTMLVIPDKNPPPRQPENTQVEEDTQSLVPDGSVHRLQKRPKPIDSNPEQPKHTSHAQPTSSNNSAIPSVLHCIHRYVALCQGVVHSSLEGSLRQRLRALD